MEPPSAPLSAAPAHPPSSVALAVSAPAVIHIAIRAAAVFVVASWITSMASAEFWNLLEGGPDAEFSRASYAIGSALSLAFAAALWASAPFLAGFLRRPDEEVRTPFDLVDGLTLVVVWLGLGNVMMAIAAFLRAIVAWIRAGGFRSTPEALPLEWFGDMLVSAFATGVVGLAFLFAAGPIARVLARHAALP